ncbi:MAG: flagellar hook-length control protein FliK, partial [Epsilonproteobacteria bacterium]|nr:flagellar hook-length control protein FliK [Campylobacterota bacterium]
MVTLDLKPDAKTVASPLALSSKEAKGNISFSALLQGLHAKESVNILQNGSLVLVLEDDGVSMGDKKGLSENSLLQLLGGEGLEALKEIEALPQLNTQVTKSLNISELKVLIKQAKEYLKNKITTLEGFRKAEIVSLPKTLKGLMQVAKKFGIKVSKITLEQVQDVAVASKQLPTELKKSKTAHKQQITQS